ncbi:MAG: histidinol dehydrogenase [Legionella sp.]|nr:MAG: histidinol dehydrogenase [Legionella sp.]
MLSIKFWDVLSTQQKEDCLTRAVQTNSPREVVLDIIQQVRTLGDAALFALTEKYDGALLEQLQVPKKVIANARIDKKAEAAIQQAIDILTYYYQAQKPQGNTISTAAGVSIETVYRPIQKVGIYVPGGQKTPLVSSVLMQAIPSLVAGCPQRVLCTPPNAQGDINPHLLVAARLCGIETIYLIGGAQAIAAMAYGTESVMKVDKLFGPGNSYVTEAKTLVAHDPLGASIDMPAGPSEVMVIADKNANPIFIAADLMAQAEHGVDSQAILICEQEELALAVNEQLAKQIQQLSRQHIIKQSFTLSSIIICPDLQEQVQIINRYAPEHLIIQRDDAQDWIDKINTAGTVFLGPWAAETMGDYITGSNHVIPTNGFAKNYSSLSTIDFLRRFSVQSIDPNGLNTLGPAAITLAQIEGLDAHAQAVQLRLNFLEG